MVSIFCPKCGVELQRIAGELNCLRGEMGLSQKVEQILTDRFAADASPQSPNPPYHPQYHGGLRWYCPGCGKSLNTHLECEACGKHLRDLLFPLVETHPHL